MTPCTSAISKPGLAETRAQRVERVVGVPARVDEERSLVGLERVHEDVAQRDGERHRDAPQTRAHLLDGRQGLRGSFGRGHPERMPDRTTVLPVRGPGTRGSTRMRGLAEKVVVVAGGGSGIGAATARRLGAEGAAVVVGDLNGGERRRGRGRGARRRRARAVGDVRHRRRRVGRRAGGGRGRGVRRPRRHARQCRRPVARDHRAGHERARRPARRVRCTRST